MIISRAEIESAVSAYRSSIKRKPRIDAIAYDTDSYTISEDTRAFSQSMLAALGDPYYRGALVGDLQRRISEGKYFVPADDIVEKMIGRLVVEAIPA